MEELKPCPFCGDQGHIALMQAGGIEWSQVECVNRECGASGPTPATEGQAIAAWNQRAALRPADGLAEDITTLDVFLAAYADAPDGDVIASVIDPADDLLTLGALRRILTALRSQGEREAWQRIGTEPAACHVLAARFDEDAGEWICAVAAAPLCQPFTHWRMLDTPGDHLGGK